MEKRMANVERNLENVEGNMKRNAADIDGKLEAVNTVKTALIEGFDEMKDVLVKMEDKIEENARKVRNTPSGDRENIIVAGGLKTDSVEMFNWRQRAWSPLQSMPTERWRATSFVYNNHVTIAGGICSGRVGGVDNMIRMNIHPNIHPSEHWSECPVKLPTELERHSNVLYNDHLMVTGGYDGTATSDCIHEVQLVPPYTVKTLSRMPEPRHFHCMEIFDDSLLIVGGLKIGSSRDKVSNVVLYDIKRGLCKQLAPLPYEVIRMASVRWGDNIVVIGGYNRQCAELDKVIIYNVKTEQSHMLPSMRYKREGCTAVVIKNNIVVLGGEDERGHCLKSVEAFNFESYTWQDLPEMSQARRDHTAVVV